ncbi:hypothetical protein [Spiroplasma endosymbiont of Dactylopius coccus]
MFTHESKKFNYYLKPNHEVVFGDTTIWERLFRNLCIFVLQSTS